ncbi:MAG TPA: quinone-dependent dihydroorotate dehydrogenase [bacterium]|nr:quinone-dependent dihydroorotate dehydrogenase [bacterium]
MYERVIKPALFRLDPERSHDLALTWLGVAGAAWARLGAVPAPADPRLAVEVCGLRCPSPVGLAAGCDKAARALWAWPRLGFGFVEVGTVTPRPQPGNPRPRLFRLPEDQALINRLGFNSPGADAVAERMAAARGTGRYPIPLGANVGPNKDTPLDDAAGDYVRAMERLHPYADFLVVNVSSPNTPGLRSLQARDSVAPLLDAVALRNRALGEKPLFVKVAPDMTREELEAVADAVRGRGHGLVATNTTVRREGLRSPLAREAGGLSGRPLRGPATDAVSILYRATGGRTPIVGVGGIMTAEDAYEKIKAGATLVEVYTGFIYGGPAMPRRVAEGLLRLMDRDGLRRVQDAVGVDAVRAART